MAEERLTEDLLEQLLASEHPEDYLDHERFVNQELTDYLGELLAATGMSKADAIRGAQLSKSQGYDIFSGKGRPRRDNAIRLAFGLRCDLPAAQRLLRLAGLSLLWPKNRRDAIIIWCIKQGKPLVECDDELWRFGEDTLFESD